MTSLIQKVVEKRIHTREHINACLIILLIIMICPIANVQGQEMRIWTQGKFTKIDTGVYVLPKIPISRNIRYIEFSDYVLEVSNITISDTIVDTINYWTGEYPGSLKKVPARLAKVKIDRVYYRFTMDSINGATCDNEGFDYFSNSQIESIDYLLWPDCLEVPDVPCLLWVDMDYTDCLTLREIVTKELIFVNCLSDYCGLLRKGTKNYPKLSSLEIK